MVDRTILGRPRAGPVAMRVLDGMYRGAAAMAGAGVHVILDDVVWEPAIAEMARRAMHDVPVLVVEVSCQIDVAIQREAGRLDRYGGAVAAYASLPPLVDLVDVHLDSTNRSAADCAQELVARVRQS